MALPLALSGRLCRPGVCPRAIPHGVSRFGKAPRHCGSFRLPQPCGVVTTAALCGAAIENYSSSLRHPISLTDHEAGQRGVSGGPASAVGGVHAAPSSFSSVHNSAAPTGGVMRSLHSIVDMLLGQRARRREGSFRAASTCSQRRRASPSVSCVEPFISAGNIDFTSGAISNRRL